MLTGGLGGDWIVSVSSSAATAADVVVSSSAAVAGEVAGVVSSAATCCVFFFLLSAIQQSITQHWLPIRQRVNFNVAIILTYKILHTGQPSQ